MAAQVGQGVIIRLAHESDDESIAWLARDEIECGLGWTWTPERIAKARRADDINLVVACREGRRLGFGLMRYFEETAHLSLLAVQPECRRQGVAGRLLRWLEASARTAGIHAVHLEMRASNHAARQFYEGIGYRCIGSTPGYYRGQEDALRLSRSLVAVR